MTVGTRLIAEFAEVDLKRVHDGGAQRADAVLGESLIERVAHIETRSW